MPRSQPIASFQNPCTMAICSLDSRLLGYSGAPPQQRKYGEAPNAEIPAFHVKLLGRQTMSTWSKDELSKIAGSDEIHISVLRADGKTYSAPTTIWSVAVDGALYVRAFYGTKSRWHQAAMREKAGRVTAAGITKEVSFEPIAGPINDLIDRAYKAKYKGSEYLSPMISARARSATFKVTPRD